MTDRYPSIGSKRSRFFLGGDNNPDPWTPDTSGGEDMRPMNPAHRNALAADLAENNASRRA